MTVTQPHVYFGLREKCADGSLEHCILEIDCIHFRITKYVEGVQKWCLSFVDLKKTLTDGLNVVLHFSNSQVIKYSPFNIHQLEDFCLLLNTITENIHEIVDNTSNNITSCCSSLSSKICVKKALVTQKSFKRQGKVSGMKKLLKNKNATIQGHQVGYLLLTEKNLFCFEDENSALPLFMYPNSAIEWKKTEDTTISFSCGKDKATFHLVSDDPHEERALWYEACDKSTRFTPDETTKLDEVLREICELFAGTFDKSDENHVAKLKRLWDASNLGIPDKPGQEPYEFSVQCNRWKDLGFQRDDPISDFRATGLLGLQNLVYFAENHTGIFLQMARNQQQSSEMEYPFATAGINISYLMIKLLGLKKEQAFPCIETYPLFCYHLSAWEELYTIVFRLFDQKWNQMLVGYMGFQKVIDATRDSIADLLNRKTVMGVPAVFDMLGILLEDLDTFKTDNSRKQEKAVHTFKQRGQIAGGDSPSDSPASPQTVPPSPRVDSEKDFVPSPLTSQLSSEALKKPVLDVSDIPKEPSLTGSNRGFQPAALNPWRHSSANRNSRVRISALGVAKVVDPSPNSPEVQTVDLAPLKISTSSGNLTILDPNPTVMNEGDDTPPPDTPPKFTPPPPSPPPNEEDEQS